MRILLSNDDGYHAPGLAVLEKIAAELSDDVWIVAPSEEQSGTGRSLTLTRPLRVRNFAERRFAVTGTPTDAVMMAVAKIMKDDPPDLVITASVGVPDTANRLSPNLRSRSGRVRVSEWPAPDCSSAGATTHISSEKAAAISSATFRPGA